QCNLHSSGFPFLLAVRTFFTGSGNFFWQWELYNWQWECLVHFIPNNPPLNLMLQLQLNHLPSESSSLLEACSRSSQLPDPSSEGSPSPQA
nr:hypothetical protein [Tanacetum cinerariifolium]